MLDFANYFPLLMATLVWGEEEPDRRPELFEEQESFLFSNKETLPKGWVYLNSRLHDSVVLNTARENRRLSITLNEFSTSCFCEALIDGFQLNIPHEKAVFPLTVEFTNVRSCSICSIIEQKILDFDVYLPNITEWLYDEVRWLESGSLSVGMLMWAGGLDRSRKWQFMQVECEKLRFIESQQEAFDKLFGGEFSDLFATYRKERHAGKCFDYSSSKALITFLKSGNRH